MSCLNNRYSNSSCQWKLSLKHLRRNFYKDQCICSKSTASPKFVSVSKRLMITAMAASSLLRLLSPGPTTLSKSSWEFSPDDIWATRDRLKKRQVRLLHRGKTSYYIELPIGVSSSEKAAPCGSFSELDLPGISFVASPFGTYRRGATDIMSLAETR